MSFAVNWYRILWISAAIIAGYLLALVLFNVWHLRLKQQMVAWKCFPVFMLYKMALVFVNMGSVYYSLVKYGIYFSKRYFTVTKHTELAVAVEKIVESDSFNPLKPSNIVRRHNQMKMIVSFEYAVVSNNLFNSMKTPCTLSTMLMSRKLKNRVTSKELTLQLSVALLIRNLSGLLNIIHHARHLEKNHLPKLEKIHSYYL